MREILFRGKRLDNGEWIQGDIVQFPVHGVVIIEQEPSYKDAEVDSDTVGQFTGLTDKNGTKIFEGDIVDCLEYYGEVYYDHEGCFDLRDNTSEMCGGFIGSYNSLKVVGNIHDNPELLEVKE